MRSITRQVGTSIILLVSLWTQLLFVPLTYAQEVPADPVDPVATVETMTSTDATASDSSVSDSTSNSSSETTESATSESETTTATETTSEEHDNLNLEITGNFGGGTVQTGSGTSTQDLVQNSTSGVVEAIDQIASTTQSGFVPTNGLNEIASTTNEAIDGVISQGGGAIDGNEPAFVASTTRPTILTGSAVVLANILNLLNTSFVNSQGGIVFSNWTDAAPTIDLRDLSLFAGMCSSGACAQDGLQLNLINNAFINNDIIVDAMSGRNFGSAGSSTDPMSIVSGDAFAGLNLVNIANTTFVDSNYMILTLNAFRGVNGDIVFPSLLEFFAQREGATVLADGSAVVNEATVGNNVAVGADSGSNTVSGAENSAIQTGTSDAHANVFNQINTMLPDSSVSILFRISGTWAGQVFGLPEGVSQIRDPEGNLFIFGAPGSHGGNNTSVGLLSTSTADIQNRVSVAALSGQNAIENAQTALISSGNSFASANIVNIANQNIIGRNWILAIVDIFGDFNGNIAFGRPDLWIGDQVEAPGVIKNGSELTYKITVINNGDSPASNVVLSEIPDFANLDIISSSVAFATTTPGKLVWNLGNLMPGDAVEIGYTARITTSSQGVDITNSSSVAGIETDNNTVNNTDSATVRTTVFSGGGGGGGAASVACYTDSRTFGNTGGGSSAWNPELLKVTRTTATIEATAGSSTVQERIIVHNTADVPISDVVFNDILRDVRGGFVHAEVWKLDTIAAHEQIEIVYEIGFDGSAHPGIYTLTTVLESKSHPDYILANGSILLKAALLPLIPSTGSMVQISGRGATDQILISPPIATTTTMALTAAAAAASGGLGERFAYLVLFILLFLASYGALRAIAPVPIKKEEPETA